MSAAAPVASRPLWAHQQRAVDWLAAAGHPGAMLHIEMGGGKTRIAIEHARRISAQRILIVAPLSVGPVWAAELARWSPHISAVDAWHDPLPRRADRIRAAMQSARPPVAVIVNYDSFWRVSLEKLLMKIKWDLIVYDESHRLKTPSSKASKFAAQLRREHPHASVLLLSGTPMPHSPLDLYGQFRAANRNVLPETWTQFRARYAITGPLGPYHVVGYRLTDELAARVAPATFRVDASQIERPQHQVIDIPVELDDRTWRLYRQLEHEFVAWVQEHSNDELSTVIIKNALTKALRLQQITSGFVVDDAGNMVRIGTEKRAALTDIIESLGGEPLVVFCRFRADLDTVHDVCRMLDVGSLELSGARHELEQWQSDAGNYPVLAVQIQAGSVGVSMVRARYAVYYSLGYSLGDYLQSEARLVRPGQQRHVTLYRLVASGTVDERIVRALDAKEDIIQYVIRNIVSSQRGEQK